MEELVFSSQRPYTLYFPATYEQLGHLLVKIRMHWFYSITAFTPDENMRLRYLLMNFNTVRFCLIGTVDLANLAWKLNVFHFEESPVRYERLIFVYKKYVHQKHPL